MKTVSVLLTLLLSLAVTPAMAESNGPPAGDDGTPETATTAPMTVAAKPCPEPAAKVQDAAVPDESDPLDWDSGGPVGPVGN